MALSLEMDEKEGRRTESRKPSKGLRQLTETIEGIEERRVSISGERVTVHLDAPKADQKMYSQLRIVT